MDSADYVIVGAGSAGAALAARLCEDGRHAVAVLEAGGRDTHPYLRVPIGYGKVFYDARFNWKYATEPVPGMGGRRMYWPRGKVLGGSSAINAMVWVRGHRRDFDEWQAVAPGWGWDNVAPVFRRIERWCKGEDAHRGGNGPLAVAEPAADLHPLCDAFFESAESLQFARNADYNGASMEGVFPYQVSIDRGVRASSARSYLARHSRKSNLCVTTHAHATRILFEGSRASGVEYRHAGVLRRVSARRAVVLCGGAINSPQLLQLSGIGPAGWLRDKGIDVRLDAPHVGAHLMDHLGADIAVRASRPTLNQQLGPLHGKLAAMLRYALRRRGPLSLSVNQAGGFVRLDPAAAGPDLQLYFSPVSYLRAPVGTRPLIRPDPFPGFMIGFNPCKPTSKGYLRVRSKDPFEAPEMQPNYLATDYDRAMMVHGMRLMRRLLASPGLAEVTERELLPTADVASDAALLDFLRDHAWTVFHQCGTCRMGSNAADSVVDPNLRVHGVDGLRVADASIFPTIPTGNTNAPSIMVGERAARLLLDSA